MSNKGKSSRRRYGAFLRLLSLSLPVAASVMIVPMIVQAATTGTVSGTVANAKLDDQRDPVKDAAGNLQADAPQTGANVRLVPVGGGQPRSTVTGPDGRYTFTGVQPGRYRVEVSLVTYENAAAQTDVTQDLVSTVDFALTPEPVNFTGDIVIETVHPTDTATRTGISPRREQLTKATPLHLYQFSGLLFGSPGITTDTEGYTYIRGSDVNQVGFQVDGIDVTDFLTNTFGTNIVSVGLKNINLYTGGANASYGGKAGGFINQVTQNGRDLRGGIAEFTSGPSNGHNYRGTNLQYGNISGNLDYYGAFIGFDNAFPGNTALQSLNASADGLLKFNYYASPNDTVTAYYSQGFADYEAYQPRAHFPTVDDAPFKYDDREARAYARGEYQQDHNTQGNTILYLNYRRNLSPTSFATLRTYNFSTFYNLHLENTGAFYERRNSAYTGLQLNYENQFTPTYRLQAGLENINTNTSRYELVQHLNRHASYDWRDPAFPADGYTHRVSRVKPRDYTAYINNQFRLLDEQITLDLGLRYSDRKFNRVLFEDFSRSYVDPRIAATYNPVRNTLFRGSFYRNSQFPDAWRTEVLFPQDLGFTSARDPQAQRERMAGRYIQDNRLGTIKSEGYDLGVEQGLNLASGIFRGTYSAVLTGYRRHSWDQMRVQYSDSTGGAFGLPLSYVSDGTAHSTGVEFQFNKRRVRESDLNGFLTYTNQVARSSGDLGTTGLVPFFQNYVTDPFLSDAQYRALNRREFAPVYDQRHNVALVINKRLSKNFETTLLVDAGSGYPFAGGTQSDTSYFAADSQHSAKQFGAAEFTEVPIVLLNGRTLQPQNPVVGRSGWHYKVSINNNFYINRDSWLFLNIDNVFDRRFVTAYSTADNNGNLYYNAPTPERPQGTNYYGKATVLEPAFISFGVRTRF